MSRVISFAVCLLPFWYLFVAFLFIFCFVVCWFLFEVFYFFKVCDFVLFRLLFSRCCLFFYVLCYLFSILLCPAIFFLCLFYFCFSNVGLILDGFLCFVNLYVFVDVFA